MTKKDCCNCLFGLLLGVLLLIGASATTEGTPSINGPFYGFGANTTGGLDGNIVYVDNLADSGPGSLRDALSAGNRIIRFDVSGDISLGSELRILSDTTIDGFSAPAPGITIRDHRVTIKNGHNIIVQGLRFRGPAADTLRIWYGASDIVVDHCSFSGSTDGALDITEGSHNITVSWNIFAKTGGSVPKTMLIKYAAYHISLFHNIYVENNIRNPDVAGGHAPEYYPYFVDFQAPMADVRNNIVWNWAGVGTRVSSSTAWPDFPASANVVNNLYSSETKPRNAIIIYAIDPAISPADAYVAGNLSLTDVTGVPQYQTGLLLNDVNDPSNHAEFVAPDIGPGASLSALAAAHQTYLNAGVRPLDAFDGAVLGQIELPPDSSDPQPPEVMIVSPGSNGSYETDLGNIDVAGTASDNIGVSQVTWANNRGGSGTAEGTTSWAIWDLALQSGENIITVTAQDAAGNLSSQQLLVMFVPQDQEPPNVFIDSPTSGGSYETDQGSIDIAGTASDNNGLSQVTWTNNRGGSGTGEGTTSWAIPDLVLQAGENIITVTAQDTSANLSSQELRITYVPPGGIEDVFTLQIDESSDDGYEVLKKKKAVLSGTTVFIGRGLLTGYHFDGVGIPQNALIVSATLSQYGFRSGSGVTVEYTGEAAGDAAPFIAGLAMSQRPRTLDAVTDEPGSWPDDSYYPSPDLSAIIQELVDRSDWQSGNAINLFIEGKTSKNNLVVNHFDGDPSTAALLEIRYRLEGTDPTPGPSPDNEPPDVSIQSPSSSGSYETDQASIDLAGTASDNVGVTQVTWTNSRGGSGTAGGTTSWAIQDLVLQSGDNTITVTAQDTSGNLSSQQLQVTFTPPSAGPPGTGGTENVLTLQIDESSDDAYEVIKKRKAVLNGATVYIGRGLLTGYHFDGVGIPQNALIVSATLSQYGLRSGSAVTVEYTGEAAGNAAPFIAGFGMSQRPRTLEAVADEPGSWPQDGYYPSPDLGAIVQELVGRSDWQSGNAINLFVEGKISKSSLVVNHFDGDPNTAALLEIRYRLAE